RPCRLRLDPDPFDGRAYTVDEFYAACRPLFDRPADFYRDFSDGRPLELRPVPHARGAPTWQTFVFDSPVVTAWPCNNLVPFKWFRGGGARTRTMLLFAPGWGRRDQGFEERMCARLARHDIDAGLLTTPFHQRRAPPGARSGEYFISPNIFWTVANFRQAVAEIRLLVRFMRERYDRLGLIGLSSGGFQMGLASDCEPVDYLFTLLSGCQVGSVAWHGAG